MSGQKYYTDGIIQYDGGLGNLYYTPTGGTGNISLTPERVNWMTTVNFSRTERVKSVWVLGTGNYSNLSFEVPITQEETPLVILLSDVGGTIPHATYVAPPDDTPTYRWQYIHTLHTDDLGTLLYIDVLTNGNVLDVSSSSVGNSYIVQAIQEGLQYVTTNFTLPKVHLSAAPDENYEDYPQGIGQLSISTYKIENVNWGIDTKKKFDTITNTLGTTTQITLDPDGGAILNKGLTTYGLTDGLVAVRFQVTVNSSIQENDSVISIKTAVYDKTQANGVSSTCNLCRQLDLTFEFSDDEVDLGGVEGNSTLSFNPAGVMSQGGSDTHNPYIEVASNVPWTITENEPQQQSS